MAITVKLKIYLHKLGHKGMITATLTIVATLTLIATLNLTLTLTLVAIRYGN